jgi:CheY-like chemotaxis protein
MPVLGGYEVASQIKRMSPEMAIILLSGSEVPIHAVALADAVVPKLEASQQLLPMIAELCSRNQDGQSRQARVQPEDRQ